MKLCNLFVTSKVKALTAILHYPSSASSFSNMLRTSFLTSSRLYPSSLYAKAIESMRNIIWKGLCELFSMNWWKLKFSIIGKLLFQLLASFYFSIMAEVAKKRLNLPTLKHLTLSLTSQTNIPVLGFGAGTAWFKGPSKYRLTYKCRFSCPAVFCSISSVHFLTPPIFISLCLISVPTTSS